MSFDPKQVDTYIPDSISRTNALSRTTHLAIAAHPDDIEIIGLHGIGYCYEQPKNWFAGIVVTNGVGAPRADNYRETDDELVAMRAEEQLNAASVGKYSIVLQLSCQSNDLKKGINRSLVEYLVEQLQLMRPNTVYLHNLADRHTTHVAVCIHALEALRALPNENCPQHIYGVEVWRDLDWLPESFRVRLDVSEYQVLFRELIAVFKSQIDGGKRYDQAIAGRQIANATLDQSHCPDQTSAITLAMDLTTLIRDESITYSDFMDSILADFTTDIRTPIDKYC